LGHLLEPILDPLFAVDCALAKQELVQIIERAGHPRDGD
jgi:hypothetical protein